MATSARTLPCPGGVCLLLLVSAMAAVAVAAEPSSSGLSIERAVDLYTQGKHAEAAAVLETLAVSNRDSKEVFLWLGRCRLKMAKYEQAREAYKRYMELAPNDPEGPTTTARTYRTEGNRAMAELWYRRAMAIDPSNTGLKDELASVQGDAPPTPAAPEAKTSAPAAPAAPVPPPSPPPADEQTGFWRQGIAGVCGARGSTTGRIIAVVIFAFMALGGIVQSGFAMAKIYGQNAPGIAMLGSWLGTGFWYVLYWGWPSGWQWAWAIGYVVVATIATAGVSAAPQQ